MELDIRELERTAGRRCNCGCGDYPLSYFVNIDEDPAKPAELHCHVPPLPFDDASMDLVWSCHFLEHLEWGEAELFLQDAFRVLAPGGRCGIVVPDTREVMRRWLEGTIDAVEYPQGVWHQVADLDAVCALFLYSTVQASPHRWAYDLDTLARALTRAGFVELHEIDRYRDPRLGSGQWFQCGLEGSKPA